jgi:hypothetical protein
MSERELRGRQGNRSEDFDPAGMTQEELIEIVVRLPDGHEKHFGDFTQRRPRALGGISEEARGGAWWAIIR